MTSREAADHNYHTESRRHRQGTTGVEGTPSLFVQPDGILDQFVLGKMGRQTEPTSLTLGHAAVPE